MESLTEVRGRTASMDQLANENMLRFEGQRVSELRVRCIIPHACACDVYLIQRCSDP